MTRKVIQKGRGYAGLEKINVYIYNTDGKFLNKFPSITECKQFFKLDKNYPIFRHCKNKLSVEAQRLELGYAKLPNGYFVCKSKLGRDFIRKTEKVLNSDFVNLTKVVKNQPIKMYNLKNEEIASFKNKYIAVKILGKNIRFNESLKSIKGEYYFNTL